jgi:beta-phosphoglucomutase-like phosphatase (HAD superfamily)
MARRLGLAGKPAPDTFLEAVRRLNMAPKDAIVVEDALAGVAAGASGGFGLVIGIGPPDAAPGLLSHGADAVVAELTELAPD